MKKLLLIIIALCFLTAAQGQEFSFKLKFVDAIGNTDSLIIGYDRQGTDTADVIFGERNIIAEPLDSVFDVHISNEWFNRTRFGTTATYSTKKQIMKNNCGARFSRQNIEIIAKHWPVTVSWDSALFDNTCRKGSVFTSINPGGWWDVGSPSNLYVQVLNRNNTATFTPNFKSGRRISPEHAYAYINSRGDTVSVFWQAFGDLSLLIVSAKDDIKPDKLLDVYPNPATESISIQLAEQFGNDYIVEVFSSTGQLVKKAKNTKELDVSQLQSGLYILFITNEKGHKVSSKILK